MPNTNNSLELLVKLGIDKSNKTDLQTQVDQLGKSLAGLKVDIKIDPSAIKALEKLSSMDFSKLAASAKKATDDVSKSTRKTAEEAEKIMKETFGSKIPKAIEKGFSGSANDIKKQFKSMGFENIKVGFDVKNGKQQMDKLVASVEKGGITKTVHFKQATVANNGRDSALWMPDKVIDSDKSLVLAAKNVDQLIAKMNKLQTEGKLTNTQFEHLTSSIKNIDKQGGMKGLNAQLDQFVVNNRKATEAIKTQERAQKEQVAELKRQEDAQKRIIENDIKRKNLVLDIERAMKSQTRSLDQGAASKLIADTKALDTSSKNFSTSLKQNQSALKELNTNATEASRNNMGIINSFKTAMEKFPIWMAASTLFYGTVRTAREFMSIIVDIDTKMVNLSKVMSEDTDLEAIFNRATQSAERFGQSISSALDSYTEFARQGFDGDELGLLADAGLVASNVGEITAQKASEYMTASLIQWKMDAKDAMGIIDSWNEISNNYATTTEKLAQGQARAGATARAMGLDFDQLNAIIGTVTASTKQSGNEIGNFIKSSLPRLVGKPAQSALSSLGVNLTDDSGNLRDVIQVYTEVAEKVKGISDSERIAVVEGLAGKYHIARMQILLDDLGSADSMYRNMYNSSVDSAGSAMDENEKFMDSLQARINLARVEIEKLALAMGDAFLTEGMIQGIQLFGDFLGVVTKFVDKFGVLPALMGTTGVALFLLSARFKTLTGSVGASIASLLGFRGAASASATASSIASGAVRGLSIAFKGLLASTGVGLVLVGVGVAIEGLLGIMGKQRETQEGIAQANRVLNESYSNNRNEIKALSDEYTKLEEEMNSASPDIETQQRYYDVQNKIAELMPSLVNYEDSYGNKIIGSSTVIGSKIALLEKQIEVEQKLQEIQNKADSDEKLKQAEKDIKSGSSGSNDLARAFENKASSFLTGFAYKEEIKNLQDMEAALEHFQKAKKKLLEEDGASEKTRSVIEVTDTIEDLEKYMATYQSLYGKMESGQSTATTIYAANAEKLILENKNISDSTKDLANSMMYDFTAMAKSSEEAKSISDVFGDGSFQKSLEDASKQISSFTGASSENFEKQKQNFLEYAETMKTAILSDMKGSDGAPIDADSYKNAEKSIDSYIDKLILKEQKVREVMSTDKMSREEALLNIQAQGDMETGLDGLNESMADYIAKLYEKASAEETVAGVTDKVINEVDSLVFLYNSLSSQTSLTAEQSLALSDAQEKLMAIYPQLNKNGDFRIDSIIAERNAQDILLRAVKASKEGQLTLEEQTTVGHLSETNSRIAIINKEIEASQKLANAYASVYESVVSAAEGGSESAAKLLMRISVPTVKAQMAQAELATLENARGGYVNTLSGALDNLDTSTSKSTASTKEAAKALETSIYVTDKYKKSLEAISLEIEKQQALREGQPNYSKIYQDSLQKEIQLEKNKKKLMEDQASALEQQIKSGKILQTGIVTTSSGASAPYSGKYATQINSSASKYGVDPNLIAAIIKQESSFNPNATSRSGAQGLMQLMPSTAKGLGVKNSFDPAQNIEGGTKYIADQIKAFGGDIKKALYAYNAGAGNVSKILASSDKYWKEPKNYANKVLANLATGTGSSKISGWNGNVTSGYGMRNDPFTGKQKMHSGVDIAGKKGDRLDSNVSGKVSFAGKGTGSMSGFGNYVAIETADGLKHFYAHLDKVIAKVGDTVAVGSQIGNIGSTGSSTGSHLHYQVNKNGKAIDPSGYLNSAKNTDGSTKEAAQVQQSIDQANSDLITLRSQILATNKEIAALEVESIQGYLDGYNRQREDYQHTLDFENAKQEAISQTSSAYRSSIDKQITAMKGQQSANQAELKFSEKLIAGGNMSAETMIMLKDRVKALKVEMLQLGAAIEDANFEKINSRMVAFDESQDDLQFLVDLSSEYMSTLTEGSAEYNKAANDQIATMQKQQRMIRTQIDEHTKDLATKKLSVQATKDLREKIEDLTLSYWSLGNGIKSSTESLVEANKKMANDVADKLIETYKDYTQERQDAHMKTIDAEMKAEEKRHKQVSDNLSKELESYRKIIQAKLDMLDKEESERDYNKEIDDLEKDRLDTLNKIALLSLDDSFEARKETANLTEKLTATEEQIAEKRHDREIELRKANLTDLIESKEEEIKNRQDLEDERYEHEKELIDKQKEYWQQYYTDLLNDERKFAKLREDIVAGNTDAIKAEFGEILDYFNETMPNLENTLDGTMQAVGTSIRQNMIDTLKEALDLMNQIGSNTGSGVPNKVADQFNADKGASTTPDKAQADAKANQKGLGQITIEKPVNLWKRVGDKLVHDNGRILKAGEKFSVYGRDDKFGGQYNVGGGNWVTDIPGYVKYKKFDTGGYTKNGEGMAMLHEKEIVLNKDDTKNFLKGINILRTLDSLINPLKMSNVKPPELAGANGNGDVNINFYDNKFNATKQEATDWTKTLTDRLKRTKGLTR